MLDHDYTILTLKRYSEGTREFWSATLKWMKKVESTVVEPIKAFLSNDLGNLRSLRRNLDQNQRNFDSLLSRYAGQSKTKEASSLREDAFQVHEARRAYLKASMDFCTSAPQIRAALDKLLVRIFSDRWREMKTSRDTLANSFLNWSNDIERIRSWSKEMEESERVFKRELQIARKQIEETAEQSVRPSRELDDYSLSTVPYLGSSAPAKAIGSPRKPLVEKAEKQSWLFQRLLTGKPTRTVWIRRWFYVKNGIFGWLSQGPAGVQESEKIGVLLCGVRPAVQEERRFCFEVKTKDTSIILQAETQHDLIDWISAFELAKRKALENPAASDAIAAGAKSVDAAFAITPPVSPEFAAKTAESQATQEEAAVERSATLGADLPAPGSLASRSSMDVTARRATGLDREGDSHTNRIIQKLDLHRKSTTGPQTSSTSASPAGGIASLISASHQGMFPLGMIGTPLSVSTDFKAILGSHLPQSSLAPSTLANPPAPTSLSKAAVVVTGDRAMIPGSNGGTPGGLMANSWGTNNWGYLNRLERGELDSSDSKLSPPPSPFKPPSKEAPVGSATVVAAERSPSTGPAGHRKTISLSSDASKIREKAGMMDYPTYYPISLRAQDAQFRMLFPQATFEERLVLVFRAAWGANDQQEFPGRIYVTTRHIYFYSNHLGLVVVTGFPLSTISEVTAATGKECDFLYVHLKEGARSDGATRITVKVFLDALRLLQRRLNYLVRNADSAQPAGLEEIMKALIKMESAGEDSPSADSWEDVDPNTPMDAHFRGKEFKTALRIDGTLYPDPNRKAVSRNATKFRLPASPVIYVPQGFTNPTVEKQFDITAKALFHVLAGDRSAVFQILYTESCAERLVQTPWLQSAQGVQRREFKFEVGSGKSRSEVSDYQMIDVLNDHLCYVITDRKTPWYLPYSNDFTLLSKIVITHSAKSKCNFAVYTKVDWTTPHSFGKGLIESRARYELQASAYSLLDILGDQAQRLGNQQISNSRRAVQIFGRIGEQGTQVAQFNATELPPLPATKTIRKLRQRSLVGLAMGNAKRIGVTAAMDLLSLLLQVLVGLGKLISAHRVLVVVLALSIATNFFFTHRDGWAWWHERQAVNFMKSLGVGPNPVMARSVWLKDLDAWYDHTEVNWTMPTNDQSAW
jgi:VAD1 Analog of StAR-related lipid transfer domain/BAR domain of APPL family/PH domain